MILQGLHMQIYERSVDRWNPETRGYLFAAGIIGVYLHSVLRGEFRKTQ